MTPPLTTVGYDAAKIGELGAQLVLEEIGWPSNGKGEKQPTVLTVKPKVVVRGSTAPAPSAGSAADIVTENMR
jgi:DNA-binding LacI/PurR family transcriptional regulator